MTDIVPGAIEELVAENAMLREKIRSLIEAGDPEKDAAWEGWTHATIELWLTPDPDDGVCVMTSCVLAVREGDDIDALRARVQEEVRLVEMFDEDDDDAAVVES